MNRSQRRKLKKQGIEPKKEPIINIKASDVAAMKLEAAEDAANTAFVLMLGIPAMVIHDKYSKIMKRVEDGKPRVERFTDLCLELYDSFDKGYLTLDDIHECLREEAGLQIERKKL